MWKLFFSSIRYFILKHNFKSMSTGGLEQGAGSPCTEVVRLRWVSGGRGDRNSNLSSQSQFNIFCRRGHSAPKTIYDSSSFCFLSNDAGGVASSWTTEEERNSWQPPDVCPSVYRRSEIQRISFGFWLFAVDLYLKCTFLLKVAWYLHWWLERAGCGFTQPLRDEFAS